MRESSIQIDEETSRIIPRQEYGLLEASKPYIMAFLIVTILLAVWVGLCAT
jgi:hypothetical protein